MRLAAGLIGSAVLLTIALATAVRPAWAVFPPVDRAPSPPPQLRHAEHDGLGVLSHTSSATE
jgi:hypothetical protein